MIKPMNAKSAGNKLEKLIDDPRYIAECKIDGYRAICDNGRFYSRLGNEFTEKIPQLHAVLDGHTVVFDGELYIPGGTSNDITTALGSKGDRSKLRYIVFDILATNGIDMTTMPWASRRAYLEGYMESVLPCMDGFVELSQKYTDKRWLLEYSESNGLEGIMLKNVDALYYPDKRPSNVWYKVKRSLTYDVVIMDYTEGKGKFKGLIGSIIFGLYDGDTLIECGQAGGMTDEVRRDITEHKDDYINRVIEISAMEITKDKHFRHPVFKGFRTDKSARQCIFKEVVNETM